MTNLSKKNKLTFPEHFIVVIGKPLMTLKEIGLDCCQNKTMFTKERFFPKILVELEVFPSISEVRRNRKEMLITFEKTDWLTFKFGHRIVDVVIGE